MTILSGPRITKIWRRHLLASITLAASLDDDYISAYKHIQCSCTFVLCLFHEAKLTLQVVMLYAVFFDVIDSSYIKKLCQIVSSESARF
jgi:hypothetical protein